MTFCRQQEKPDYSRGTKEQKVRLFAALRSSIVPLETPFFPSYVILAWGMTK